MHIAIAGGSGFIGQALVNHFQKQHQITVISRDPQKIAAKQIFPANVKLISWEMLNTLQQVDVVINLAGESLFSGFLSQAKKDLVVQSRLTTTQKIVSWLRTQQNPITFLCASGINIYPPQNVIYSENDTLASGRDGEFLCALAKKWEQAANQARSAHCRVINLRQAVVLDKSGGILKKVLPITRMLSGVIFGDGEQPFLWVSLTDVVHIIDFLIKTTLIQGPVNVVAPEIISQEQFARQLAGRFGKPCFIHVPDFLLKWLMGDLAEELMLTSPKAESFVLRSHKYPFINPDFASFLNDLEV